MPTWDTPRHHVRDEIGGYPNNRAGRRKRARDLRKKRTAATIKKESRKP